MSLSHTGRLSDRVDSVGAMTQTPIVAVADHECPNCGATSHHRARVERTSPSLPAECRAHLAAAVIRGLGGTVRR